ncbi:hypothetical protein IE4872_CH02975 [Rhizobium gallicum]|uniref:Uncharacterized protein n=1 Tax=Rhizobium gallicum TaxID=56730 RepID=A0A1L5NL17_9HYPH|nr:hypothetical protein IE4872_CH02975 [Rhizobium gallicum]
MGSTGSRGGSRRKRRRNASGTARVANAKLRSFVREVEDKIRQQPLAAVAVVAALAFVFVAKR